MSDLPLVLIIDDVPENIMVLGAALNKICRVRFATAASEGLEMVAKERPDLVLLDIMMPIMDGYQVLQAIKSDPANQSMPIIFVTAKTDPQNESEALQAGAVDFIHKPINPAIVRSRVSLQLELSHNRKYLEQEVFERTQELAIARREAENAQAVVTRFMKNISHEMRTPLVGILGFTELGKSKIGKVPTSDIARYFDHILQAGYKMQALVESMLQVAQAAWDEMSTISQDALVSIEPQLLLTECLSSFQKIAEQRQQRLILDNQATIHQIEVDPIRIRKVFEALISNALRFSPNESTVWLQILNGPPFNTDSNSDTLIVRIIDEGCGLPENEINAVFEPFYESSRNSVGKGGPGLGLALCKSIVKQHKGILSAANRPEGGVSFEVQLPLRQRPERNMPISSIPCF